jgi:ubiquinone biosynthesis protein
MAGAGELGRVLGGLPAIATRLMAVLERFETMTRDGLVLSPETVGALARARARQNRWRTVALWVIALAFLAILWTVR